MLILIDLQPALSAHHALSTDLWPIPDDMCTGSLL